jgi:hypothetical protein
MPIRPSGSDTTATKQPRSTGQPKTPAMAIRVPAASPVSFYQGNILRQQPMANVINQVSGPGTVVGRSAMPPYGAGPAKDAGLSDDRRTSDDLGPAEMADAE